MKALLVGKSFFFSFLHPRKTNDSHSITNCPLSPNVCPSSGNLSSHSVVHSFDPSDQAPSHPASPQGSLRTTNRLPLISTALTIEWERFPTRPSTEAFLTPLRSPSRVLNQQPKRRSSLALTSSSCQNLSRSRMSYGNDVSQNWLEIYLFIRIPWLKPG